MTSPSICYLVRKFLGNAPSSTLPIEETAMSSNLSFATYAFPEDDLNGPVVDVNTGQTVYNLSTPKSLLHRSPTEIKSPDGTTLGEVQVNPLFFPGKVSVHGRERKDFMEWAGDGWLVFGNRTYKFQDDEGRSFYWKDYKVHNACGDIQRHGTDHVSFSALPRTDRQ